MVENSHRSNTGGDDSPDEQLLEKRSVMKGVRTIETGGNRWLKG
jgi:hypothetical protein